MRTAISVDRLTKTFPEHTAFEGVSFDVPERTSFALLGGHGAGKSTMVGCLSTHITPTSGTVQVGQHHVGVDDRRIRREIGIVSRESRFDPARTVWENLLVNADARGFSGRSVQRGIEELSGILGIVSFLDRRYGNVSDGLKRRADIVGALVHDPSIVVLDEPTPGLSLDEQDSVWETIRLLTDDLGLTTILTTADEAEASRADSVCVIAGGRAHDAPICDELRLLLHDPTALSLIASHDITAQGDVWVVAVDGWQEAREVLRLLDGSISDFDFVSGAADSTHKTTVQNASQRPVGRHSHLRAVAAS